jgi:hypothetical protein
VTDVEPALLERIAGDNAMDLELYEFARDLHAQRYGTAVE